MQEDLAKERETIASTTRVLESLDLPERYEVVKFLGSGGMGVVVQARDHELEQFVAIKVLQNADDAEQRQRFMREAQLLAQLKDPYIVQMRNSGITPSGSLYQVMELLKGESLADRLKRTRLSSLEFRTVVMHVAYGLEHAYAQGIVHRDVKPSNIFLTTDVDGELEAKVVDFGIAKKEGVQAQNLTATNTVLGSPLYMSPEQTRGENGDHLSDIYALGCVMYECLAGHPPFQGESVLETLFLHGNAPPQRIETKSQTASALVDIVMSCLSKDPRQRPQSYKALREAVETVLPQGAISLGIKRPAAPTTSVEPKQQEPLKVVALFSIALLILATLVCFIANPNMFRFQQKKTSAGMSEAERRAKVDLINHNRLQEKLKDRLQKYKLHLSQAESATGEDRKRIFDILFEDAIQISVIYRDLNDNKSARKYALLVLKFAEDSQSPLRYKQHGLEHYSSMVFDPNDKTTWAEAETALNESIKISRNNPKNQHPAFLHQELRSGRQRGLFYFMTGRFAEGKKDYEYYMPWTRHIISAGHQVDRRANRTWEAANNIHTQVEAHTDSDRILLAQTYLMMANFLVSLEDSRGRQVISWIKSLIEPVKECPEKKQLLTQIEKLESHIERTAKSTVE